MSFRILLLSILFISACSPISGPDKGAAGAVLGGGLGAGAGAIIGNQVGMPGAGIAVGAGMAAASGLTSGLGLDIEEGSQLSAHRKLDEIKNVNKHNRTRLADMETRDRKFSNLPENNPAFLQVFFDEKRASLKLASNTQIQHLAETLRSKRYGTYTVELRGYSTDSQVQEENKEIISARLASVKNSLVSNGVPESYIKDVIASKSRTPIEFERNLEKGVLVEDRTEPNNRYNNRVEIFIKY